jgi:hypothetical protein
LSEPRESEGDDWVQIKHLLLAQRRAGRSIMIHPTAKQPLGTSRRADDLGR